LATFKNRFQSRGEIMALFAAVSLPIFAWSIILIVAYASQYILRLSLWETVGVVAYVLAYALLEALIVFAIVMAVLLILPARWHGRLTVPLTAAFVILTTVFVVFLNVRQERALIRGQYTQPLIALAVYIVALIVAYLLIRRSERLAKLLTTILDRLVPLAVLYSFLALVGAAIVLVRNLTG
jgi:hypothetical protein